MPQQTLTGSELLARVMVTEAALIAVVAVLEKMFDGADRKPFDGLRDEIQKNIAHWNHPEVQAAIPVAIDDLLRLVALSKENITKL